MTVSEFWPLLLIGCCVSGSMISRCVTSLRDVAEALFAEVIGLNVLELVLQERVGLEEIQVVGTSSVRGAGRTSTPVCLCLRVDSGGGTNPAEPCVYNNDRINPRKRWAEVMLRDGTRVTMTGFGFTAKPTFTLRFYTVRRFESPHLSDLSMARLAIPDAGNADCRASGTI